MVLMVVGGPAEGRFSEPGVSKPRMEYSTPLRGDTVRFSATRKKYPKFMTFNTRSMSTGSIIAVSTKACPDVPCARLPIFMTSTSSDPRARAFRRRERNVEIPQHRLLIFFKLFLRHLLSCQVELIKQAMEITPADAQFD